MLIYSMSVSVDGYIADREGAFGWSAPSEELFRFHIAQVRELGGYLCGRRLYETMLVWETDPSPRDDEAGAAYPREVEAEQLVARDAPSELAVAVGDEAVHRDAHRVDQHGLGSTPRRLADRRRALR